jgi:CxxC-x17-CxxC domain-containing protein
MNNFSQGNRFSGDRNDRPMYDATCAECGKACKVPFNPTGEKPVYCSDCFDKHRENDAPRSSSASFGGGRRFESRGGDFGGNNSGQSGMDPQMKELLVGINTKLDDVVKLLTLVSGKKTLRVEDKAAATTTLEIKDED